MRKNFLAICVLVIICFAFRVTSHHIVAHSLLKTSSIGDNPMIQGVTQLGGVGGSVHTIAVQAGFLYATLGATLVVYDVQDPTHPVKIAQSPVMPAGGRGMSLAGNYAYVANGLGGLRIFDIHTSTTPIPIGIYQTEGMAQTVKVVGNYAYVAKTAVFDGVNYEGGGLDIIDISDPTAPFLVGNLPVIGDELWIAATLDVVDEVVYFGEVRGYSDDGLRIIDVSQPTTPIQLSLFTFPPERGGVYDIVVRDGVAFVTSTYRLYTLDITDPFAPALIGAYGYPAYGGSLTVLGNYAYITDFNSFDGLRVVDVSDPTNLSHVTMLETGAGTSDITAVGETVYWAGTSFQSQIGILDVANPTQPITIGTIDTPSLQDSYHVAVHDNYLYTSEYFGGSHVTDITNPTSATILSSMAYSFDDAVFIGEYGYWVREENSNVVVEIYDMANPQDPELVGDLSLSVSSFGYTTQLIVNHPYVYVMSGDAIYVVNVDDPTEPTLVEFYFSPYGIYLDMIQKGEHLYLTSISTSVGFLQILDTTTPENLVEVGIIEFSDDLFFIAPIAVIGEYVYVGQRSEIIVFDVVNPLLPTSVGSFYTGGYISKMKSVGNYLFITHNQFDSYPGGTLAGGLQIFNVADTPLAPEEVAFHRPFLYPRDIVVDWGTVYTVNGPEGVFVFRFAPPAITTVTAVTTTLDSPFDQTSYIFPAATFSETVIVTHTTETADTLPPVGVLGQIDHHFVITAVYSRTDQPAQPLPNQIYTVTIHYNDAQRVGVIENSLTLYYWNGQTWQVEPNAVIDTFHNIVTATPRQLGRFAILGETYRQFLPISRFYSTPSSPPLH